MTLTLALTLTLNPHPLTLTLNPHPDPDTLTLTLPSPRPLTLTPNLAQAAANLALYDLVGSRDELASFLAAASAALGWPTNVGRVPLLEETQIRRGVSDGDALAVHEANLVDMQLFTGLCAPAGARACDALRGARSGA